MISFSVIIPIGRKTKVKHIKLCLESLENQTIKPAEIITIIDQKAPKSFEKIVKRHKLTRSFRGYFSKSQARNFGSKRACGNYLANLDIDQYLDPTALAEVLKLIRRRAKAIIITERVVANDLLGRIRNLESQFDTRNPYAYSPQVVEKKLFWQVGGFDEKVDILDDWSLHFRLRKRGIRFSTTPPLLTTDKSITLFEIIERKYVRGQYLPILASRYPPFRRITFGRRLKIYGRNLFLFTKDPLASLGFILLKPIELLIMILGSLNPAFYNPYDNPAIAQKYNRLRSSNYNLYKDYAEKKSLLELLPNQTSSVLEIGSGTGRITKFLIDLGVKVLPSEPSSYMVREYLKNKGLPKPIVATGDQLQTKLGKFDCVLGIRVIWHLSGPEKHLALLKNAALLTNNWIIFDFSNRQRYRYPPLSFVRRLWKKDYFFTLEEIRSLAKKAGLKIDLRLPLDVLSPIWLNLLPRNVSLSFFPLLYRLEKKAAAIIAPARQMFRFTKAGG